MIGGRARARDFPGSSTCRARLVYWRLTLDTTTVTYTRSPAAVRVTRMGPPKRCAPTFHFVWQSIWRRSVRAQVMVQLARREKFVPNRWRSF